MNDYITNLLGYLENNGFKPYIYHKSNWDSYYIKFDNKKLRSIRVADHKGRPKYKYKWNIRKDFKGKKPYWKKDRGVWRKFYPFGYEQELLEDLKQTLNYIKK